MRKVNKQMSSRWHEQSEFARTGSSKSEPQSGSHCGSPLLLSTLRQIAGMTVVCLLLSGCGSQQAAQVNSYGVEKGPGSTGVHTVLEGDTVYKIAQNYQLPMREIITLNHIQAPYVLNTGFRVKLPPPNEHQVREGDTIYTISRMYETSVNRLVKLNDLRTPYRLTVGQKLRLPTPTPKVKQSAVVQKANFAEPVQNAHVQSVDRQALNNGEANKTVTPNKKPTLQKASVQRAKIPKQTPKMSGNGRFMRPVDGRIISNYGPKPGGLHNDGINIKAVRGAPVRAAENGVVVYTGDDLEGYGNLILVRHENRMMSAYAHLDKTLIKRGDKVVRGQSIGTVGSTGQVDSPQLHFEIRRGSEALDPVKYL